MSEQALLLPSGLEPPPYLGGSKGLDPDILMSKALTLIRKGSSVRGAARALDVDESTLRYYGEQDAYFPQYARAREDSFHSMAEQVVEIADNVEEESDSRRVRFDARRWLLSKMLPKVYGDRLDVGLSGTIGVIDLAALLPDRPSRDKALHVDHPPG